MNRKSIWAYAAIALLLLATACGGSSSEDEQAEHMDEQADEHVDEHDMAEDEPTMDHEHVEAPDEFASLTNPFGDDEEAIEAGQVIFETHCVACHGPEGVGDGPGAEGLDPKPANLSDHVMMPTLSDGYLFWRVSKGGAIDPFNSAMPVWEQALSEDERWQVISYVRTLSEE